MKKEKNNSKELKGSCNEIFYRYNLSSKKKAHEMLRGIIECE
jgi:hypothetical protein